MPNKSVRASSSTEDKELRPKFTSSAPIYYYGFDKETNDFVASNGFAQRQVQPSTFISVEKIWNFHIPTFGRHNIMNATAVIGLLYIAGFDLDLVASI